MFTKREIALFIVGLVIALLLTVLAVVYVANKYVFDRSSDPLSKVPPARIEQKE